jgi:hypothetical protein
VHLATSVLGHSKEHAATVGRVNGALDAAATLEARERLRDRGKGDLHLIGEVARADRTTVHHHERAKLRRMDAFTGVPESRGERAHDARNRARCRPCDALAPGEFRLGSLVRMHEEHGSPL